jgi:uncharacterized protein
VQNNGNFEFTDDEITSVIKNIVLYCRGNSIEKFKLGIVGSGEPMLNFDSLSHLVKCIKNENAENLFLLYTITNGTILSNEQLDFFYENMHLIDLNFSLDGYKELHDSMRGKFSIVMESISKYENKFGQKPMVNCTVHRDSVENADKLIAFFIDNSFSRINFSIVFDCENKDVEIARDEYELFLDKCEHFGIKMRQRRHTLEKIYDCAMYGNYCGVGRTNIFYTKSGIYPCGRFLGLSEYNIAKFDKSLSDIENALLKFKQNDGNKCYYDNFIKRRVK